MSARPFISRISAAQAENEHLSKADVSPRRLTRALGPGILLFAMVVATYWPSLSADFIWDDDFYVTENLTLRSLNGLGQIWSDPKATPQYYPLAFSVFWIEYQLWGLQPLGYHLVNILLHAANAVLFAKTLQRLQIPGAWLAATVFGVHPVHVESVTWVTELKNVLSLLFYLLAMLKLIEAWGIGSIEVASTDTRSPFSRSRLPAYLQGCGLFGAALLSKTVACSLQAVLLLFVLRRKKGRLTRQDAQGLILLFLIGFAIALITVWVERNNVGASGDDFQRTPSERVLIAGRAVWFYAGKLVWPVNLAFIYPRWTLDVTSPTAWFVALSALLLPLFMAIWSRRLSAPLVAILCFGGSLFPTLGFFNVYFMRYSFVADHFQYLASLSLICLFTAIVICALPIVIESIGARFRVPIVVAHNCTIVLIVVTLACLTWQRQSAFQNLEAILSDTLAKNPTCMVAHVHLARIAASRGDFALAERYYRDLLRFRTDDRETHDFETNLGMVLASQERYPEAIEMFQAALKRVPDYFEALGGLGSVALMEGRFDLAISYFQRSLEVKPQSGVAYRNLGTALLQVGRCEAAERELRRAVEIDPRDLISQYMLSMTFFQRGRLSEAEQVALTAQRLNPSFVPVIKLLQQIRKNP